MGNLGKHTPFLLTACSHNDKGKNSFTLYSISDKLHFEFDEPFLHKKLFIGSQHGWLTVLDLHCDPTLLNPLTGESISLPSITTLPEVRPHHSVNGNIVSYFCRANYRLESPFLDCTFDEYSADVTFKKVLVSSNPSISSSNFFAAALFGDGSRLMIAKPGEGRWNLVQEEEWYKDIMFCQDGKLICLTNEGAIHEIELKDDDFLITETAAPFVDDSSDFNMYLALDSVGRILVIYRTYEFETRPETSLVEVFRLIGSNGEKSKWERINSLDGQAIFVGTNALISLRKQDINREVKADTIYFTDDWWGLAGDDEECNPRDICAYDLTSNSIKQCCPDEHRRCSWPLPVWIHLPNHS
ncbi:hypothetical protein LUZ62_086120 [Rhynchospora pubera]|uniref:KIB1-4 beta-propeller domain-containing protein n=1 Tax=Rhynchospora pubera TaxID=906938 RepID=A0AAV8C7V8_9POAL|nr:hypothetical protein LUZ62_086120 [Rhynchospora pubera]